MRRVAVFVDGGGIFHVRNAIKQKYGKQLDFEKFCKKIVADRILIRSYFCSALPSQAKEAESYKKSMQFLDRLDKIPYVQTTRSWLLYPPDGGKPVQKGVDMKLAMYMLKLAYNDAYDVAILVCGDSDFEEVVTTVKDMGKQVEYFCCPHVMHADAISRVSDVVITADMDWFSDCLVDG